MTLLLFLGVVAGAANGSVHNINKSKNYSTIQSAIDDSSNGDEIQVDSGTYYETVNVNKNLTLRGIGMPVVNAGGSGSAITLASDGIRLQGFTATGGGSDPNAGIKVTSSNNTLIENNANFNNYYGIRLSSSSNNTLIRNNASNNGWYGIILYISCTHNTLIENNASNNGWYGVVLYSSSNYNLIYNNIFENNAVENFYFSNSNSNTWNISKQSGPNIIGGSYLGGNFWAKTDGSGFSQNCLDGNLDGICDSPYNLDSNNIDYLPLTLHYTAGNVTATLYPNSSVAGSTSAFMNLTINDTLNTTAWYNITFPGGFDVNYVNVNLNINGSENPAEWTNSTSTPYVNISSNDQSITANSNMVQYINLSNITVASTRGNYLINITTNNGVTSSLNYTINEYGSNLTIISSISQNTSASTNATYIFILTNNGTVADSYNLTYTNPDGANVIGFDIANIFYYLDSNASSEFTLNVTNTSPGTFRVNVTATSTNDSSKESNVNTITTVTTVRGMNLTNISALGSTTAEGNNATYILSLTNNGTDTDSYTLAVNPGGASQVSLNVTSPVSLNASETMTFTLNVNNTLSGIFYVNVTAWSNNDPAKIGYINTTTTVTAVRGVDLINISALGSTTAEGNNATYILSLTNNGTDADSYTLVVNPGGASQASLNVISPVSLNASETMTFTLNVTNTLSGIFYVNVTAWSNNDPAKIGYINTTTTVTAMRGVELTNISALGSTTAEGNNATYILSLTNNGTDADSYTLVVNPGGASQASLNVTSPVSLNASETMIFTLNVTNTTSGIFYVDVTAWSNNDPAKIGYINTTTSVIDITPPASITNLMVGTYAQTYINWTWTEPQDPDFSKVIVYINGIFQTNITKGTPFFNAQGLTASTAYTLSTRTVDIYGNINTVWVNNTQTTASNLPPPELTDIKVLPLAATVTSGKIQVFTATPTDQYGNIMSAGISWISSNTTVGTIGGTGVFKALKVGISTITATSGNVIGTSKVTVVAGALANIIISPGNVTINVSQAQQFNAKGIDANGNDISMNPIWGSNNTSVGTINGTTGIFTALAAGTASITATVGNISANSTITVLSPTPAPSADAPVITGFSPSSPVSDIVGSSRTFNLTSNQTVNVTWYINDTAVFNQATVTNSSYTKANAVEGTWIVNATVNNTNGTVSKEWTWIVMRYGVNLTTDPTSMTSNAGINASYSFVLHNNGTTEDTYSLFVVNENNASTAAIDMSEITLESGASKAFILNVTNTSPGTFHVNVTAWSNNDSSKIDHINTTTTIVPIGINITNPATNGSITKDSYVNVTVTLGANGLARYLNWEGVNYTMFPNTPQPLGTVFFLNKTDLFSGIYLYKAYANDTFGNSNVSETRSVTVDRTIMTNLSLDPVTGNLNQTLIISSPDKNATVTIYNGTNATLDGKSIINITIDVLKNVNSAFLPMLGSDKLIGENLSLGPEGAHFSPDIQIRFNYTDAMLLASGISASQLRVKFYNTTSNSWIEQTPFILNEMDKYIIANVSHFSTFALVGTVMNTPAKPNGGNGGSGGGVVTTEPYDNIARSETYDKNLVSNIPTKYTFKLAQHGIYEITVTGKESENNIALRVESLKGQTRIKGIVAPPGTVYKNLNILSGSTNIKKGLIKFKVENSWISNNSVESVDMLLVKWDGSQWVQLVTQETMKDDIYSFYEASTDSLGTFAITALKGAVVPAATPVEQDTQKAGTAVKTTGTKNPTPVPTEKIPGFEAIIAAFAIALFAACFRHQLK